MGEEVHPDVSEHVPTREVSDRLTVAKRAGVGTGMIIVIEELAVELSGQPWDAFKMRFFSYRAPPTEEYENNPEEEHAVAYDFVDEYFTGEELAGINEFVEAHNLR